MEYFLLFANCILTEGATRSVICDLDNKNLYFIPNEIKKILDDLSLMPILKIKENFNIESQKKIDKYFQFFIDEGIGFYTNTPNYFPRIRLKYLTPEIINNAILDIDKRMLYDIKKVIEELSLLRCKFLEIRAYEEIPVVFYQNILDYISKGYFRNLDIITKYPSDLYSLDMFKYLCEQNGIIGTITLHSAKYEEKIYFDRIITTSQKITSSKCCGQIGKEYFSLDIKTISESQKYNTCLNKKVSVDVEGNIKNCPSMVDNYGNIKDTNLATAIKNESYKAKWIINKKLIKTCSICEFRDICTDCRAFLENPLDLFSKPLKCGYDPFTTKWSDWKKDINKENGFKYYDFKE